MGYYPVFVRLDGRFCVVIGGGRVAARKVEGLLACGARVLVISPSFVSSLEEEARQGRIMLKRRCYQSGDLEGAFMVIAATGDRGINSLVQKEAESRGILFNAVDDPELCNFIVPSVIRRGDVQIAISTGGRSPALARRLRERLEAEVEEVYGVLAALLGEVREEARERIPNQPVREAFFYEAAGDEGIMELLRQGRCDAAKRMLIEKMKAWE